MTAREHPSLPFVFRLIEDAAARGVRCPTNDQIAQAMYRAKQAGHAHGTINKLLRELVKSGRIALHGQNPDRVIAILTGPHAGKSTSLGLQASPWSIDDLERRAREVQQW